MLYRTEQTHVLDKQGRRISILQPLLHKTKRPRMGWAASIMVNGVKITHTGKKPLEVVTKFGDSLALNQIEFRAQDLWYTLNLQWIFRTDDRDVLVDKTTFPPIGNADRVRTNRSQKFDPKDWLMGNWECMINYLAIDEEFYSYNTFLSMAESTLTILNPSFASRMGCQKCWQEFAPSVAKLRSYPIHSLNDARTWLTESINKVNKVLGLPALSTKEDQETWNHAT